MEVDSIEVVSSGEERTERSLTIELSQSSMASVNETEAKMLP